MPLSGKSLALLCYLALEGAGCRSELARLLWSELPLALARRNLRRELHRLRATGLASWLWATGERVGLHTDFGLDVHRFRALRQAEDWREATALLRGPPLGDLQVPSASRFGRWQAHLVARLNEEQLEALAARADELARQQRPEAAQWVYARMLRLDPLRESAHRGLLDLLYKAGDTLAAHQQYTTFAGLLADKLALAPLPDTTALHARQTLLTETQPSETQPSETPPSASDRARVPLPPLRLPFTGRNHELQTLARTRAALITGEAGVGKTRLLQEFLGHTGALWLNAAPGQPGQGRNGRPFAPLASLFQARPELLHELDGQARAAAERLAAGPHPESEGRPQSEGKPQSPALLEAALWTLLGHRTLVAEDLNGLDCATLGVVGRLVQRSAAQGTGRILLSLCTPSEPAAIQAQTIQRPELAAMLCRLEKRGQLTRLCLNPLDPAQVAQLIASMAGQDAPLFSARLHQATAGQPLFLLETLQALREAGRLDTEAQPWQTPHDLGTDVYAELPLPTSLAGAVRERAARLGPAAERVLGAAAVSPEPFGPARLQAVCALSESETRQQLERAAEAGLLCQTTERDDTGFRFSHAVYGQTLLAALERPRRELLERQFGTERRALFSRTEDAQGLFKRIPSKPL